MFWSKLLIHDLAHGMNGVAFWIVGIRFLVNGTPFRIHDLDFWMNDVATGLRRTMLFQMEFQRFGVNCGCAASLWG